MKANVIVFEVITFALFLVFYQGARRALGRSRNRAFFAGAIAFSLVVESSAVALGMKNFYWYSINGYYQTYPLGGYIVWLGVVPLAASLLFYMVAATSYMAASTLMPRRSIWARSAVAGAYAVVIYALVEPVAVTNHWWTWTAKTFYVIDVPVLGLLAVFGAAFLLSAVFDITVVQFAEPKLLKKLEDATIRRWPVRSKKLLKNLNWAEQLEVFGFRLLISLVVFAAYIAPLTAALWALANRGHIPPGW